MPFERAQQRAALRVPHLARSRDGRRSELVGLDVGDLSFGDDGLEVTIRNVRKGLPQIRSQSQCANERPLLRQYFGSASKGGPLSSNTFSSLLRDRSSSAST